MEVIRIFLIYYIVHICFSCLCLPPFFQKVKWTIGNENWSYFIETSHPLRQASWGSRSAPLRLSPAVATLAAPHPPPCRSTVVEKEKLRRIEWWKAVVRWHLNVCGRGCPRAPTPHLHVRGPPRFIAASAHPRTHQGGGEGGSRGTAFNYNTI